MWLERTWSNVLSRLWRKKEDERFEWDESKRQEVICRRGVDFRYAALMFDNTVLVGQDKRIDYGEERFAALGHVNGEFFNLIFTPRDGRKRIITAWKASRDDERKFKERFPE